jgi:hypothetical protein
MQDKPKSLATVVAVNRALRAIAELQGPAGGKFAETETAFDRFDRALADSRRRFSEVKHRHRRANKIRAIADAEMSLRTSGSPKTNKFADFSVGSCPACLPVPKWRKPLSQQSRRNQAWFGVAKPKRPASPTKAGATPKAGALVPKTVAGAANKVTGLAETAPRKKARIKKFSLKSLAKNATVGAGLGAGIGMATAPFTGPAGPALGGLAGAVYGAYQHAKGKGYQDGKSDKPSSRANLGLSTTFKVNKSAETVCR